MDLARLTARLRALPGGARLIQGAGAAPAEAPAVTGVAHDSRAVAEGDLFCCVPGARADSTRPDRGASTETARSRGS